MMDLFRSDATSPFDRGAVLRRMPATEAKMRQEGPLQLVRKKGL